MKTIQNVENQIRADIVKVELLKKNVIPGDEQWSAVYNLTKRSVAVTFFREYHNVYRYEL